MFRERPSFERRVLLAARTRGHAPAAERAVERLSRLGEHGALWLAVGVAGAALQPRRREAWGRAVATVAGAYALNTAVKLAVGRRRPVLPGLPPLTGTPSGLSFPSSHAATSFAAARAYSRLGLPPGPLYGVATAMAASRVYLGVHYPSDVLAGAALGSVLAAAREPSP